MISNYPHFKKYAQFILDHHLDPLVQDMIDKARELKLPILKLLQHLSEEQIFMLSKEGLKNELLLPLIEEKPFEKVIQSINNWKANALLVPKDQIDVYDITSIYNVRKLSLIDLMEVYDYSKIEGIELNKEIEIYFTSCINLALEAYEEINRSALKDSQDMLNGILNNIPVIVTKIDHKGNILQSQGHGLKAIGLKEGELVGKNVFEIFPNANNVKKALSGEYVNFEGEVTNKNRQNRFYQNYFFPQKSGVLGFSIDITDQKVAEEKLREGEYFIQRIASSTPIIIQVYDRIHNVDLYSNKALYESLGYTHEQINQMGKSITNVVHPEDIEKLKERNDRLKEAKDGEIIESEMRAKDVNGTYRWIFTRSMVFKRTEDGEVWQILSTSIDTTDKKIAEEQLQQQLRIFDTALSNTVEYNYIFDTHGKFKYVNKPLLNFWGKSHEEVLGKSMKEIGYSDQLAQKLDTELQVVIKSKQKFQGETEFETLDGNIRYFQYTFVPVINDTGEVEAIVGSSHDFTDFKETAEKQYRSIFESTNDAIFIYDMKGNLVEINPAAYKMHGYSYKEMVGMNWKKLIDPTDHQTFLKFMDEVSAGKNFSSTLTHIRKDGRRLFVEKTGTGFTYKGQPHLLAVVHDETERKKAEAALRESEDRFRTLADNIPNLAWIADQNGQIVWFNKRWYEYTGTNIDILNTDEWQGIQDPEELNWVIEKWNQAIKAGEPFEMIVKLKGADQQYLPFLTRVVPVKNEMNKIVRWFGTSTDITDQIRTEEILEKKNRELIKINNDLDNFIYTASHDLKSPVSNLEGLLNLVSDEDEELITEKGKSVLPMVKQSLIRLKTVIKELTEIARIQKDLGGEEEIIQLKVFIQEIFDSIATDLKKFNGQIDINFTKAPHVKFSKKNLRSILYNLISNAIKYSDPSTEGLIQLTSEKVNDQILITVSDNGLGIPEQQKEKVFTMFKRYHTHVEGSGVGLYIVKRIIENAGGKIELESEVGKGSVFRIFLPL